MILVDKTEKEYDKEDYDESVRVDKIWDDDDLSKKPPKDLEFREHQILSQKMFDDGHTIETVIILHGLIELNLNKFWMIFVACNNDTNEKSILNLKERSYFDLTNLFNELGLLEDTMIVGLKEFNDLRNKVTHNFYGIKRVIISETELKNKFENGLNVSGSLPIEITKFLVRESKTNGFAKKFMEELTK